MAGWRSAWVVLGLAATLCAEELPVVDGRPNVAITSNEEVALFVQAIGTDNAIVRIANDVQLDLSGLEYLHIGAGVQVIGGRSSTERGAKLYTRTFPRKLFLAGRYLPANGVRITGLRIEGAEMGIASSGEGSDAITVFSSTGVEIDNNEIYGWRGAAVEIRDGMEGREDTIPRVDSIDAFTVRVHDNFIHHNQRYGKLGYGVSVHDGAYVLIARNVFDYNRHAITAGGAAANGYWAQSNLVLEHGGLNVDFWNLHTHQFDVHGTQDCCLAELYCGKAGEQFWFRDNTILYDHGTGIKLRGRPTRRSVAEFNVFRHPDEWGGCLDDAALAQNDPGGNFESVNNTFGRKWDEMLASTECDFDADGKRDAFVATGATWWYQSKGLGAWLYLRDSRKRMAELELGDFNGDGYCDVRDEQGVVSLTKPGPELHGRRLQSPGDPAVYLVLDGKRYRIPDEATYANLFRDRSRIETIDLSAIPVGGTLSGYAKLARSADAPAVYLLTNDRKHWITSPQAMDHYNFDWNKIAILPRPVLDSQPRGGDLSTGPLGVTRSQVPSVVGLRLANAAAALTAAGFVRGTVRYYPDPTCSDIGRVTRQSPTAGSFATPGTPVDLSIAQRPRAPCR